MASVIDAHRSSSDEPQLQHLLNPLGGPDTEQPSDAPAKDDASAKSSNSYDGPAGDTEPGSMAEQTIPRDIAFEAYENVEEFGGIIDFALDLAFDEDLESFDEEESFASDKALRVDTIIGQAPLLQLQLPEEDVEATEESTESKFDSATLKRAAAITLIVMPWSAQKDERSKMISDRLGTIL